MEKLTKKEATEILKSVNLPASSNKVTLLALANKSERKECIEDLDHEDRENAAAIEIQRVWRGYSTRCKILDDGYPEHTVESQPDNFSYQQSEQDPNNSFTILSPSGHDIPVFTSKQSSESGDEDTQECEKPRQSNTQLRQGYAKWIEENDPISFDEYYALVMQSWWPDEDSIDLPTDRPPSMVDECESGRSTRFSVFVRAKSGTPLDELAGTPEKTMSLKSVQFKSTPSEHFEMSSETFGLLTRDEAAEVIQRAWRGHVDTQVYQYYRDLISFKFRGDPSLLLRCINPREAELLDSGSGSHVKFRLAGRKFPPNIYYKIFTHRPIIDLCASSPKDYTKAEEKRLIAKQCNNKGDIVTKVVTKDGWYQRWENNGWRLVSDRLLKKIDEDAFVYDSAQQKMEFKHTRLLRRKDVEKKRKQKKIEWMKKMYRDGMLWSKQGIDSPMEKNLEITIKQMVSAVDQFGHGIVDDWEVDELIEWTNGLNYDHYVSDWKEFATSTSSDQLSGVPRATMEIN